ncbi:MAG: hypothetical protein QXE61_04500 [Nitrososphaerota archaeon]
MSNQQRPLWREEILEQLTLARLLSEKSGLISGRRISLILVDNIVEYILKLYCSKFVNVELSRKQWEELRSSFPRLIKFVMDKIKDQEINWDDLKRYHTTRNTLYHEPFLPLTVDAHVIKKYTEIALNLVRKLLDQVIEMKELNSWESKINHVLTSRKLYKSAIKIVKLPDGLVKIIYHGKITLTDGIKLVIYGFASEIGRPPNNSELHSSLLVSGFQIDKKTLNVRLSEMRRDGILRKKCRLLILTEKATKSLKEKFFIETGAKDTLSDSDIFSQGF